MSDQQLISELIGKCIAYANGANIINKNLLFHLTVRKKKWVAPEKFHSDDIALQRFLLLCNWLFLEQQPIRGTVDLCT